MERRFGGALKGHAFGGALKGHGFSGPATALLILAFKPCGVSSAATAG